MCEPMAETPPEFGVMKWQPEMELEYVKAVQNDFSAIRKRSGSNLPLRYSAMPGLLDLECLMMKETLNPEDIMGLLNYIETLPLGDYRKLAQDALDRNHRIKTKGKNYVFEKCHRL